MLKKTRFKISVLSLSMVLMTIGALAGNTAISSGAWETGSNWSLGTVPVATDNVIVPAGITITVKIATDVCGSLSVVGSGAVIINASSGLSIAGNLSNVGSFTASATSTLTFNGSVGATITGGGTYLIAGSVVLNMGSKITALDIQDANFIAGINAGGKYFINFKRGTWKMNNTGTLNDCYNIGSTNALTIPYNVVIESDAGTMNLGRNAPTGNMLLSGELYVNGGVVNVQLGQVFNSGQDFRYQVNGGSPQLYISSGTLNIGAGFNANTASDYIDFHMTGGTMIVALNGYSNWITFQLADVVGGKTFMSAGTVILQDASNANIEDLDMGGSNVAATQYSVTGGTVQLGYINTQNSSSYFGINAQPATNYPNIDFEAGVAKNVSAFIGGNINMLSLYVNSNMTFDATGFPNVTIMGNNGSFAFDDEGGFIQGNNTVTFSGSVPQLITSTTLTNEIFYNLTISNTSGNVRLGVATTVSNLLNFTSGKLDASNYPLTLSAGNVAVSGSSASRYIITGDGVTATGLLNVANIPPNLSTLLPVGTSTYYLPVSINPGANAGNSYAAFAFSGAATNAIANGPAFNAGTLSKMLNAEWDLIRTAGSGTASITLNWNSSGTSLEGSAFQGYGLNIGVSQYSAGRWLAGVGSGSESAHAATASVTGFSQFTVVGNGVILPNVLMDFQARPNDNQTKVFLSWTLSDGIEMHAFQIEKSTNDSSWKTVGILKSDEPLSNKLSFSMTDSQPSAGVNYYRLKMFSSGGRMDYSGIRQVTLSRLIDLRVFPNPASTVVRIYLRDNSGEMLFRLITAQGQILQQSTNLADHPICTMNISSYPSGTYMIQVISCKKLIQTKELLIVR